MKQKYEVIKKKVLGHGGSQTVPNIEAAFPLFCRTLNSAKWFKSTFTKCCSQAVSFLSSAALCACPIDLGGQQGNVTAKPFSVCSGRKQL